MIRGLILGVIAAAAAFPASFVYDETFIPDISCNIQKNSSVIYSGSASDPYCTGYRSGLGGQIAVNLSAGLTLEDTPDLIDDGGPVEVYRGTAWLTWFSYPISVGMLQDDDGDWLEVRNVFSFQRSIPMHLTMPGGGTYFVDLHGGGVNEVGDLESAGAVGFGQDASYLTGRTGWYQEAGPMEWSVGGGVQRDVRVWRYLPSDVATPEPSSALLIAAGLGCLVCLARRRNSTSPER